MTMRAHARPAGVFTATYDLLARVFLGGPRAADPARLPALDALLGALGTLGPQWPPALGSLLARDAADPEAAQRAFLQRIATPAPGRYIPPYASVYLDGGTLWGPATFEVLRWYEAEGLRWDSGRPGPGGTPILAPDHVGVELAFLTVVSGRPAAHHPRTASADRLRAALAHAATWLPRFHQALQQADAASTARTTIADWTAFATQVVQADLERARPFHPPTTGSSASAERQVP